MLITPRHQNQSILIKTILNTIELLNFIFKIYEFKKNELKQFCPSCETSSEDAIL